MRALVTGGAGFIGSHLADALIAQGHDVTVLDNLRRGNRQYLDSRIRFVEADIRDAEAIAFCIGGTDVVFHLAAQSNVIGSVHDIDYSFSTNVGGTLNLLRASAEAGVRRVVFASSREVYGEPAVLPVKEDASLLPKNPYGASKLAGEAYCRAWQQSYGLECQVLRFANIFGPRDRDRVIPIWLDRAAAGEDLELYGGNQVLDFCWIGQAVEALLAAAECELTGPINVGSGKGTTLRDLAERILRITGGVSKLSMQPSRDIEVTRFVADVRRMQDILKVDPEADPLLHLSQLAIAVTRLQTASGS